MNRTMILLLLVSYGRICGAQSLEKELYAEYTLSSRRSASSKDIRERVINRAFETALDSETVYKYETACEAAVQFQISNPLVKQGIAKMFAVYGSLEPECRQALLEAAYSLYPNEFRLFVKKAMEKETTPFLFAMAAIYLMRPGPPNLPSDDLIFHLTTQFPGYDSIPVLSALHYYLTNGTEPVGALPDLIALFVWQRHTGIRIIYSFQRWNRDYAGLALIQNENGQFVRNREGKLMLFRQLARSASGMPYFIANGNTPQGIYRIVSTDVSKIFLIGPTPNLHLILPFEKKWSQYFDGIAGSNSDSVSLYASLLPPAWRNYPPVWEAWTAGNTGRYAIMVHGSAMDPAYFLGRNFYPFTPMQGCLCSRELWNPNNGHILESDQLDLIESFHFSTDRKSFLFVIDLNDKQEPVSREEIEEIVSQYERKFPGIEAKK